MVLPDQEFGTEQSSACIPTLAALPARAKRKRTPLTSYGSEYSALAAVAPVVVRDGSVIGLAPYLRWPSMYVVGAGRARAWLVLLIWRSSSTYPASKVLWVWPWP